jgi:hypothetical protein
VYFSYLRNYCIHLYKHGYFDLINELHQIQKDNLDKGYLLYQGKIHSTTYTSIANTAFLSENYDWACQFIDDFKSHIIDVESADEAFHLNKACYYFYVKQYEKSIEILPPNSNNLDRHLIARRLEIKIYFETDSELLIYKVEAFKVYIHRASKKIISEATRERNANFANLLYQLIQTPRSDKSKLTKILSRIEEKQQVAEKEWLLEKVNHLIPKKN